MFLFTHHWTLNPLTPNTPYFPHSFIEFFFYSIGNNRWKAKNVLWIYNQMNNVWGFNLLWLIKCSLTNFSTLVLQFVILPWLVPKKKVYWDLFYMEEIQVSIACSPKVQHPNSHLCHVKTLENCYNMFHSSCTCPSLRLKSNSISLLISNHIMWYYLKGNYWSTFLIETWVSCINFG
jgi:hypothetical protein